jgi:hypothetical protein
MKKLSLVAATILTMAAAPGPPGYYTGNGTLSVTTSSALINTMTVATGATMPNAWTNLTVWNPNSGGNVAVCPLGGTCTCPQNGVAATNGDTILASGGSWTYILPGTAQATPSIVACSGTPTVEFQW